ncbi:hypothetical protein JJQ72_13030 [Paenibacillus sp. F411]|uniref:hypothetical protein n=1 Tax=Paenibacillus sp. F411 TaxID=2820239 RepID=UPI001AAF299B|nr:hypothetical protein [Paenibacillus sp. F411]MBO2944895.1 hypothetical protein [Paenibacillus sp. F411]
MLPNREFVLRMLADSYFYFLKSLPFENESYMKGMREARTKFVANLHITLLQEYMPKSRKDRRYTTDFVSPRALILLKSGSLKGLSYEHIVPKTRFIKDQCEIVAQNGLLQSSDFIYEILDKYLWTATVHSEEEKGLIRTKMPPGWDGKNILARYDGIVNLEEHDKSYLFN